MANEDRKALRDALEAVHASEPPGTSRRLIVQTVIELLGSRKVLGDSDMAREMRDHASDLQHLIGRGADFRIVSINAWRLAGSARTAAENMSRPADRLVGKEVEVYAKAVARADDSRRRQDMMGHVREHMGRLKGGDK